MVLEGTDSSGATTQIPLAVEESQVLASSDAPSGFSPAQPGDAYLLVTLMPAGSTFVALDIPPSAVTLEVAGKVLVPAVSPDPFGAQWYFAVPDTTVAATLNIGPASATVGASAHAYDTAAMSIDFLCSAPTALAPVASRHPAGHGRARGSNAGVRIGAGIGALALLGAAGALHATRRRRFSRAHAQGRVRFLAPPLVTAPGEPPAQPSIVVKILGWLDITGIDKPTDKVAGPVKELAVYLVLNRGRSFTSLELADEIWCMGRKPVTAHTIRTYVHTFRRTFGRRALLTEGFTYVLADTVGCDYDDYRVAVAEPEQPAGALRALALLRGRVLQGCFVKAKNSPFAWAETTASRIDVEITDLAHQTAAELLASGDPRQADSACAAGIRVQPSNLALRLLDIEVGLHLGGQEQLARRLRAGQVAMTEFPGDLAQLEARANELGFDSAKQS